MWRKPFCASTQGAQTWVKFCTHICLNIDIVVRCSCDRSMWQWWHVSLSRHARIYVCLVYFDMSSKFVKKIPSYMNKIYFKYSLPLLLTGSHNSNPTHLVYTPLVNETVPPLYYVGTWQHYLDSTLFMNIPPSIFYLNQTTGTGNIFLDSGGTVTFANILLYPMLYPKLVSSSQT